MSDITRTAEDFLVASMARSRLASDLLVDDLGRQLRRARERLGLSTDRVAHLLGVTGAALRQWETGRRHPTAPHLVGLAALYADPWLDGYVAGRRSVEGIAP